MPTLYGSQTSLDVPATLTDERSLRPCDRCRTRKLKCEFEPSVAPDVTCKNCLNGGYDCTSIRHRKTRRACTESEVSEDSQPLEIEDFSTGVSGPFPNKVPLAAFKRKRPSGACDRCRTLKVQCESNALSDTACKRCFNGGHDCTGTQRSRPQKLPKIHTGPEDLQPLKFGDIDIGSYNARPSAHKFEDLASLFKASPTRPNHSVPSNANHDQKDARYPQSSTRYGKRVTANLAFGHVRLKRRDMFRTLARYGYEGPYLIQVGFNPELLRLGQGMLQEIFIFLDSQLDPAVAKELAAIFVPFPVTIYSPEESRHVPSPPENESILDLWTRRGIYRESIQSQAAAPTDGNDAQKTTTNSAFLYKSGGGSGSGDRSGRGDKGEGSRPPNGSGNSSGSGGASGNTANVTNHNPEQTRTREVSIPFSSTLTYSEGSTASPTRFKTNACVEIKIEENFRSQSRPEGLNWGGPWFEAKMALLDAEIQTAPTRKPEYHLSFSQIRFIASQSPSSILSFSPSIIRAEEDNVKSKTERSTSGGIRGSISANPSLRFEGNRSHTSGEERTQKRWEVVGHCLPSDINDDTGAPQTTMVWKYSHNTAFYSREARNIFEPRPAATFGLSRASKAEPCLEVEAVMCYSWFTPSQTFRDWFTGRSKPKSRPPMFLNFLHQTSVVIDLEGVKESAEWVVGLTADERHPVEELGKAGNMTVRQLESNDGASDCHVYLQAALHGRIDLNEQQRRDARPVLESLKRRTSVEETGEASRRALLTPSPTPSPTSSIFNKSLNQSSDILSEDMGSDMDIDEEPSATPRARLLLEEINCAMERLKKP